MAMKLGGTGQMSRQLVCLAFVLGAATLQRGSCSKLAASDPVIVTVSPISPMDAQVETCLNFTCPSGKNPRADPDPKFIISPDEANCCEDTTTTTTTVSAACGPETPAPGVETAFQTSSRSAGTFGAGEMIGVRGSESLCGPSDDGIHVFYVQVVAGSPYRVGVAKDSCCASAASSATAASIYSEKYNQFEAGSPVGKPAGEIWWREDYFGTENVNKTLKATVKCWQTDAIRPSLLLSQPLADDFLGEVSWPTTSEDSSWQVVYPYAQFKDSANQVTFSWQKSLQNPEITGMSLAFVLNTGDGAAQYQRSKFWRDCATRLADSDASWSSDFKTDAFCQPMGKWIKISAYKLDDQTELAFAVYEVLSYMEGFSLMDIFSSSKQKRVFTKNKNHVLSRGSAQSPTVQTLLGASPATDAFLDEGYALVANHPERMLGTNSPKMNNRGASYNAGFGMGVSYSGHYKCNHEAAPHCGPGKVGCYGTNNKCNHASGKGLSVGYAVYVGGSVSGSAYP